MWFNGFMTVIDMALARQAHPLLMRYRDALVLGCFREDVWFVGGINAVVRNPSLSHFCRAGVRGGFIPWLTPDAGARTEKLARRALREFSQERIASAMVQLGRALHPLVDMACPVHAQGVAHGNDPFEWCVEAMAEELRGLPASAESYARFADVTRGMARHAQGFRIAHARAHDQARRLIPLAAGHAAALFEIFIANISEDARTATDADPLKETLPALEMSERGLSRWFLQLDAFCRCHGGRRHYAQMLDLIGAIAAGSRGSIDSARDIADGSPLRSCRTVARRPWQRLQRRSLTPGQ